MFSVWYSFLIGLLMIVQWVFFLATGQVPELQTEPFRIACHLAAELVTAITLISAGIGLLQKRKWGRDVGLVAHGLLVYTLIVSPGYFAQKGEWPPVVMFGVMLILAVGSLVGLVTLAHKSNEIPTKSGVPKAAIKR